MFESSRGPGFIGVVLGMIVLLGFGSLFLLVMDGYDDPRGEGLSFQVKEKEKKIESAKAHVETLQKKEGVFLERIKQKNEVDQNLRVVKSKQKLIIESEVELERLKKLFSEKQAQFEDYKKQYRIAERDRAVGEEIPQLITKDGKTFEQVKIRKISALGIAIRHKNGLKRIPYQELPDKIQDRFQFIKEDAKHLAGKEKKLNQQSMKGKKAYLQLIEKTKKKRLLREHRQKMAKYRGEISKLEAYITFNSKKIQGLQDKARAYRRRGNTGMNYDTANKANRQADELRKLSQKAKIKIIRLQKELSKPNPQL